MLAWWISASSALRDPRRDRGLPPWNMTPSRTQNEAPLPLPPPPAIPSSQAYKKHTETWARRTRGGLELKKQRASKSKARRRPTRKETRDATQAALVWVCGEVVLGEGNCEGGPLFRPASLWVLYKQGVQEMSWQLANCFCLVCLTRSAKALE